MNSPRLLYNLRGDLGPLTFRFSQRNEVCVLSVRSNVWHMLLDYDSRTDRGWLFDLFADRSREVASIYLGVDGKPYSEKVGDYTGTLVIDERGIFCGVELLPPKEFE